MIKRKDVGYVLRYTRVLQPTGEQFEVTTNLPLKAKDEDFKKAFSVMSSYPEERMHKINDIVEREKKASETDTPLNREQRRKLENAAKKSN